MSMDSMLSTVEMASSIALAVSLPLWLVIEGLVHHRAESSREVPTTVCHAAMATSAVSRQAADGVQATFSRAHIMWLPSDPRQAAAHERAEADRLSGIRRR